MYRLIQSNTSADNDIYFDIEISVNYNQEVEDTADLAASKELDSMDISSLDIPIENLPEGQNIDFDSEMYRKFINLVNKVDELLELRGFDTLGDTEISDSDTESEYRAISYNAYKDIDEEVRVHGRVLNIFRIAMHKETRSSRRSRPDKMKKAANSEGARKLNSGEPMKEGTFESIVVKCTVSQKDKVNIDNKEFYSYKDVIEYIDTKLDTFEE